MTGGLSIPRKARLGGEILATYTRVRWLLRRHDLPRAVELLRRGGSGRPGRAAASLGPPRAAGYAHAVVRVLRLLPTDSRCLVRSLVLLAVLARRGTEAELVIGVLAEPEFAAHAWVECEGISLLRAGAAREGRLVEL